MVLPGDVTPVEIICHLPAVCEDLGMSYVYIPSKAVSKFKLHVEQHFSTFNV